MLDRRPHRLVALAALSGAALAGCPESAKSPVPTTGSAAPAKPAPPTCTLSAPIAIDDGAATSAGITKRRLEKGKIALGYAGADGSPRAAIVDDQGKVEKVDVDWAQIREREPFNKDKMVRTALRVTPIGWSKEKKFRVTMDLLDTSKEKNAQRYLRCGAADEEPVMADPTTLNFDDPTEDDVAKVLMPDQSKDYNAFDTRDCRSFTDGERVWAVATRARREAKDNRNILVEWLIADAPGKQRSDHVLAKVVVAPKDKRYPGLDHFVEPVSVNFRDKGLFVVAREGATLRVAKVAQDLTVAGTPAVLDLGGPAAKAAVGRDQDHLYVLASADKLPDLFGAAWKPEDPAPAPKKLALGDGGGAREMPTIATTPDGAIVVAFAEGPKRRARLTFLDKDFQPKLAGIMDVSPEGVTVVDTGVVAMTEKRAFVSTLDTTGKVTGVIVSCQY